MGERIRFEGPAHVFPVHAWKHQIEDDKARAFFLSLFQSYRTVQGCTDGKTSLLQMVDKKIDDILLIFDNENRSRFFPPCGKLLLVA